MRDNRVVGADVTIDFYKNDLVSSPELKQHAYGAGIFLRHYKPLGGSGFFLFLQGRAGYHYRKNESVSSPSYKIKSDIHSVGISAYPGISYAVSRRLHVETGFRELVGISYAHEKRVETGIVVNTFTSNGFSVYSSLNNLSNIYAGFRLLLSR